MAKAGLDLPSGGRALELILWYSPERVQDLRLDRQASRTLRPFVRRGFARLRSQSPRSGLWRRKVRTPNLLKFKQNYGPMRGVELDGRGVRPGAFSWAMPAGPLGRSEDVGERKALRVGGGIIL